MKTYRAPASPIRRLGSGSPAGWLALALWLMACVAVGPAAAAGEAQAPSPALTPDQVVRAQLEALRANGPDDQGIAICFGFASPENQVSTGPVERFARMVKSGPYALMLTFLNAEYGPLEIRDGEARQAVTLTGPEEEVTYLFVLSRQSHPACRGCWMTDAVHILGSRRRIT